MQCLLVKVVGVCTNPDRKLLDWTEVEYRLFRALEYARYGEMITRGFSTVEDFIATANQVLNRRKSRAGKVWSITWLLFLTEIISYINRRRLQKEIKSQIFYSHHRRHTMTQLSQPTG